MRGRSHSRHARLALPNADPAAARPGRVTGSEEALRAVELFYMDGGASQGRTACLYRAASAHRNQVDALSYVPCALGKRPTTRTPECSPKDARGWSASP